MTSHYPLDYAVPDLCRFVHHLQDRFLHWEIAVLDPSFEANFCRLP